MITDLVDSVKARLYERATSPLSGTFALAWVGFNWQSIALLLFDEGKVATRIETFHASRDWINSLLAPLGITGFLLFAYPFAAFWVYSFAAWMKSKSTDVKARYDATRRLPLEVGERLVRQNSQVRAELVDAGSRLEQERQRFTAMQSALNDYVASSERYDALLRSLDSAPSRDHWLLPSTSYADRIQRVLEVARTLGFDGRITALSQQTVGDDPVDVSGIDDRQLHIAKQLGVFSSMDEPQQGKPRHAKLTAFGRAVATAAQFAEASQHHHHALRNARASRVAEFGARNGGAQRNPSNRDSPSAPLREAQPRSPAP